MDDTLLRTVVAVAPRVGHRVFLRFDDGTEGELDLRRVIRQFTGLFAPLQDPAYLGRGRLDAEGGTICWPNGADLDPVVLYCAVRGIPIPDLAPPKGSGRKRAPKRPSARPASARRDRRRGTAGGSKKRRGPRRAARR